LKKIFIIALMLFCVPLTCFATDLKLILTDPAPQADKATFIDDDISVRFYLDGKKGISFDLQNLTNKLIKIDWNQVLIIDLDKQTHKTIHNGVIFSKRDEVQAPSIIPPIPLTKLSDSVSPLDKVAFEHVFLSGDQWVIHNFISNDDVNKTIGLFLPLEIGGTLKYYSFSFMIANDLH